MKKIYKKLFLFFFLVLSIPVFAQKYEAENATLTGGASKQACATCSGSFYVAQGEGNLSFDISLPKEGFYNILIRTSAPGGEKFNNFEIGANTLSFKVAQSSQFTTLQLVNAQKFQAGSLQVKITKSWGWINIDYIEFQEVDGATRFNLNQTLVNPNPTPEAKALFDFLLDNYGDKIISGVMTLNSMDEVKWLKENTGKEPALVGIDFMHCGRNYTWYNEKEPLNDAKTYYGRNGIPALMWHWRDPSRKTEEFYVKSQSKPNGTVFDISRVSDVNSAEYKAMISDIDYISGMLKELQAQNIPVVWRPLHEAAGGWFWWGAKGAAPLKSLWQIMYNRMVNHHGLKNLIWVWTREPGDEDWYPGDQYVDIVGRDIYKDGDHGSQTLEFGSMNQLYGGKKMITLSEVGSFPDVDNLIKDGPAWSWFMPWYGDYTRNSKYNSLALWQKMFAHDYVITLDEMPNLKTYQRQDPIPDPVLTSLDEPVQAELSFYAYPTSVVDNLFVKNNARIETIEVYNSAGASIKKEKGSGSEANISLSGLRAGFYVVVINGTKTLKVWKQ